MRSSRVVCSQALDALAHRNHTLGQCANLLAGQRLFGRELGKAFLHLGAYLPQMLQSKIVRFLSHGQHCSTQCVNDNLFIYQ